MHLLLKDVRFGARMLVKHPGSSAISVLALALGIGLTAMMFSIIHGAILRGLPFDGADRLVHITRSNPVEGFTGMSVPIHDFEDYRARQQSFTDLAGYYTGTVNVSGIDRPERFDGAFIMPEAFALLRVQPFMGRIMLPDDNRPGAPHVMLISHDAWQARFGADPDIIGRVVRANAKPTQIIGVMPPGFAFPTTEQVWVPLNMDAATIPRGEGMWLMTMARLRDGVSIDQANVEVAAIAQRLETDYPDTNRNIRAEAVPFVEAYIGEQAIKMLYTALGAVFMVLLIACANVANLLLVRGALRAGELAVRTALGASRRRILAQLMTENLLLALVGGALGLVVASWTLDMLRALAPADLPRMDGVALNGTALLFAGGLVLFSTLVFGLAPALHLARGSLSGRLLQAARSSSGPGRSWGRFAILTAEVALSTMLLLGAGLLMRSLLHMHEVDPGYETAGVAHFSIGLPSRYETPEQDLAFFTVLKQRLEAVPGVDATGLVMPLPLGPSVYSSSVERTDRPSEPGRTPSMLLRTLDDGAFSVLRITLLRGRLFDVRDRHGAQPVALINRTAAEQYWPGEDPIGRQIEVGVSLGFPEEPRTIVGVVEDIRALSLTQVPEPEVIVPFAQAGSGFATVVMSARDLPGALAAARREVQSLDPNLPLIRPGTMAATLGEETASTRFYLTLLGLFAALALVLAAVGIYGVVAFQVAGRRREIGVRMALGARMQEVVRLVVWQGLRPAIAGLALGLAASAAAGRVIAGLLFDVPPHDLLTYAGVTVVLVGIVIAACLVPAGRASRIPPASALRS
jgi:putative ABC transport system permease protein